jgi:hypothetical protein
MNREDVINMFQMRVDGCSMEEIAKRFGVTRERVRQIFEAALKDNGRPMARCIYKGLRNWMLTTGNTAYKLCKDVGVWKNTTTLYNRMLGKKQFEIEEIKSILAYTGMTFEEAFGEVEE